MMDSHPQVQFVFLDPDFPPDAPRDNLYTIFRYVVCVPRVGDEVIISLSEYEKERRYEVKRVQILAVTEDGIPAKAVPIVDVVEVVE